MLVILHCILFHVILFNSQNWAQTHYFQKIKKYKQVLPHDLFYNFIYTESAEVN